MNTYNFYSELLKPSWAPPAFIFGPVWSVLYILIAISFGYVFYLYFKKQLGVKTAIPFLLNLIFNFSFTYFQFGLRNNFLATIDVLLVLITLVWSMFSIRGRAKWVIYTNIPYLLWVLFATCLQFTITYLNR